MMELRCGVRHDARRAARRIWYWAAIAGTIVVLGLVLACGGDSKPANLDTTNTPQTLTDTQTQARQVLAERLSAPAGELMLVSDEVVQWSDSSLGCPEAGMMYAQVITPGRRITFSYQGDQYEVHTSDGVGPGTQAMMVSCEGGTSY